MLCRLWKVVRVSLFRVRNREPARGKSPPCVARSEPPALSKKRSDSLSRAPEFFTNPATAATAYNRDIDRKEEALFPAFWSYRHQAKQGPFSRRSRHHLRWCLPDRSRASLSLAALTAHLTTALPTASQHPYNPLFKAISLPFLYQCPTAMLQRKTVGCADCLHCASRPT